MQSRSVLTASKSFSALFAAHQNQTLYRRIASGATVKGKTAKPAIHPGDLEAGPFVHRKKPQGIEKNSSEDHNLNDFQIETKPKPGYETEPLMKHKIIPQDSSAKLKSSPVNYPLEPNLQQRRRNFGAAALDGVSCAGLDGTPWPESKEKNPKQAEMDNEEYYKNHKASPLSEIEMAETRKPITKATDGAAQNQRDTIIGWKPEQLETAEETLLRATRIWKENAMRGIPEAPHSRVLRELRGEWF